MRFGTRRRVARPLLLLLLTVVGAAAGGGSESRRGVDAVVVVVDRKKTVIATAAAAAAAAARPKNRSAGLPPSHLPRGGGALATAASRVVDESPSESKLRKERKARRTLNALHQTSFLVVASTSMVIFSPLPSLTRYLSTSTSSASSLASSSLASSSPQARAVKILSVLSAASAAVELFLSPLVGTIIDTLGRKRPYVVLQLLITFANLGAVLRPGVRSVCASRTTNGMAGGFLIIVANAIIADMFPPEEKPKGSKSSGNGGDSSKDQMGSAMGKQAACVSLGFLLGALAGGRLTDVGERAAYGAALALSALATMNATFRMSESLDFAKIRPPNDDDDGTLTAAPTTSSSNDVGAASYDVLGRELGGKLLEAPLSSVRLLFRYGPRMRTLSLLMLLQTMPVFMGDVFQVFAREEWMMTSKDFANLVSLFGILGIVSNVSLPLVVRRFGLRAFTLFAIASGLLFPATAIFADTYRPVFLAGIAGLYGGSQKVGTSAAMTSLASELGVPQGRLQGEKASMLALLKIASPIVYGALYLRGKAWAGAVASRAGGATTATAMEMLARRLGPKLPFVLNVILGICALALTWQNLY